MLVALPDLAADASWVQVLGRIAVHENEETRRLPGSAQRLLAVLVASGADGTTAERIAEEIWGDDQPNPWRPALRMAVARLRKQLPTDWDVVAESGGYRILTGSGWIDAWRLDEIASARDVVGEDDLWWMLDGQPFGDIDLLEIVGESIQHLRMLQITIAERFCSQEPDAVSIDTCTVLTSLVRDHPYNDRLAVVVGRTLSAAGRRTEALAAISSFAEGYASEFGEIPTDLADFLASDLGKSTGSGSAGGAAAPEPGDQVAKELRHLLEIPLLGRERELEELRGSRNALLTGAMGSGKSRLLAELISHDANVETTYVVGDDRLDLALGPFAVAMPLLRDELVASVEDETSLTRDGGSAERAASTRAWRIVLAHLEARSLVRPQRLVVDDAQLLDSASLGLLRLLVRSNTGSDVSFVVCGRSDFDDSDWDEFVRGCQRAGLVAVELGGLDLDDLHEMVFSQFPDAIRAARHGLAADVYEASGGLPAVAGPLILAADPDTLALPEHLTGASALARITTAVAERVPEIVGAAAILGQQFSIGTLIKLTEFDENAIFRALDELWSAGLILETDDPDQVRFRHVLVQRAFLEGIPLFRRANLHRRAAELTPDAHQRADHYANSGALVPAERAADSLRDSARLYAKSRQWRKVAHQLRRIDELDGVHLDSAALTLWAEALDLSGADGAVQRRAAYDLAIEVEDWVEALDAALSGLPEAERPDGDQERIDMLAGIPAASLPNDKRFDRVFHLSRQNALVGDHEQALRYADLAISLAVDADEIALSHASRWTATRHIETVTHKFPESALTEGTLRVRTRLAQMTAIGIVEDGDFKAAQIEAARYDGLASELGDPMRIWQSMGLKAMFALGDGDFERAETLALHALEFADLHAMPQGASAYVGHRINSFTLQDRLPELAPSLDPFRANMSATMLGQAAVITCDSALGVTDLAQPVQALVSSALERPSTFTLNILMFVGQLIPVHAPDLVTPSTAFLAPFADRAVVVAFGAGNLGPVVRVLAQLATDTDERLELAARSIEVADRHGSLVWRVHTRLDHAELGHLKSLDQALKIAKGSGLESVVQRRAEKLK